MDTPRSYDEQLEHRRARISRAQAQEERALTDAVRTEQTATRLHRQDEHEEREQSRHERRMETTARRWNRERADPDSNLNRAQRAQAEAEQTAKAYDTARDEAARERDVAAGLAMFERAAQTTAEALTLGILDREHVELIRIALAVFDGDPSATKRFDDAIMAEVRAAKNDKTPPPAA